ncbi:MAG: T9SS type A sorting domain-containing protein, partial [Bacteroidota bacterium]
VESNPKRDIKLFPNPANEGFQVKVDGLARDLELDVQVVNVRGQVVAQQPLGPSEIFPTSGLANGMYWVMVRLEGRLVVQKLWIRHHARNSD